MKFAAFVLLAASAAFLETSACSAEQAATPPVERAAPNAVVPPPAPVAAEKAAPAPARTRSLQKAPVMSEPVAAGASKPDSGTPDVVVGGLPGAQPMTPVEKQP